MNLINIDLHILYIMLELGNIFSQDMVNLIFYAFHYNSLFFIISKHLNSLIFQRFFFQVTLETPHALSWGEEHIV